MVLRGSASGSSSGLANSANAVGFLVVVPLRASLVIAPARVVVEGSAFEVARPSPSNTGLAAITCLVRRRSVVFLVLLLLLLVLNFASWEMGHLTAVAVIVFRRTNGKLDAGIARNFCSGTLRSYCFATHSGAESSGSTMRGVSTFAVHHLRDHRATVLATPLCYRG